MFKKNEHLEIGPCCGWRPFSFGGETKDKWVPCVYMCLQYMYIYTIIHMCNIRINCTYSVHTVIVMIYIFERQVSKVWAQNIEVQVIQFQKYVWFLAEWLKAVVLKTFDPKVATQFLCRLGVLDITTFSPKKCPAHVEAIRVKVNYHVRNTRISRYHHLLSDLFCPQVGGRLTFERHLPIPERSQKNCQVVILFSDYRAFLRTNFLFV